METTTDTAQSIATGTQTSAANPAPTKLVTNLDPATVFATLGNEMRWQIVLMLADGRRMSISEVAYRFRRQIAGVGKQLRLMNSAGVLGCVAGEDRRESVYYIPKVFRAEPGFLDFGICRIPLPMQSPG